VPVSENVIGWTPLPLAGEMLNVSVTLAAPKSFPVVEDGNVKLSGVKDAIVDDENESDAGVAFEKVTPSTSMPELLLETLPTELLRVKLTGVTVNTGEMSAPAGRVTARSKAPTVPNKFLTEFILHRLSLD
jgi:hypothetical protein